MASQPDGSSPNAPVMLRYARPTHHCTCDENAVAPQASHIDLDHARTNPLTTIVPHSQNVRNCSRIPLTLNASKDPLQLLGRS
eukprot:3940636-Rhodomonas_salina.3